MRRRDRDPTLALLRRIVNRIKRTDLRPAVTIIQYARDCRRQRRLPVVHMTDRPHVHMGLRSLKNFLCHCLADNLVGQCRAASRI